MEKIDTLYASINISSVDDYLELGSGIEGTIYKYNDDYAIKIIHGLDAYKKNKLAKIKQLSRYQDDSFTFPMGLVTKSYYDLCGYYMKLVNGNTLYKSICMMQDQLHYKTSDALKDDIQYKRFILEILIQGAYAIQRAHRVGISLGDIHLTNVMVDENNNPIFIDTDNFRYDIFDFDVWPGSVRMYQYCFGFDKSFSYADSDNFIWAIRVLQLLVPGFDFYKHHRILRLIIEKMNISAELKDGLKDILLNPHDIPSIGPILEKINVEEKIIDERVLKRSLWTK